MGYFTRARKSFRTALASDGGEVLPEALREQAETLLSEIEGLLVRVELTLKTPAAELAIDGRPLDSDGEGGFVAGTRPAGKGEAIGEGPVEVLLDPGSHVFLFRRKGFSDALVNRSFVAGARQALEFELDTLPATIYVTATQKSARVTVDDADVGFAPVEVIRPAGSYIVEVLKEGFTPFSTRVTLEAGGASRLSAPLPILEQELIEQWWFWTIVGSATAIAATGVAVGTYYATREPSPPSGGTLGWSIDLR